MRTVSHLAGGLALSAVVATTVAAQAVSGFGPFVAYPTGAHFDSPASAGASMTVYNAGIFGLRGSGAILLDGGRLDASAPRGWDVDGDLLLRLGRASSISFSLVPYAFAGLGGRSRPVLGAPNDYSHTWSYGGGVALALSRALEITGEARQRAMRETGETKWRSAGPTELRLGAAFRM